MAQMPGLLDTLGDMDDLEHFLQQASQPGELAEVDLDRARELLGDDAARSLERLAELAKMLEEAGLIERARVGSSSRREGIACHRPKALSDLFRKMMKDRPAVTRSRRRAPATTPAYEHKPYEWGDPFRLNVEETVKNAIWRGGGGTPVQLQPVDFEVERTENTTRSSTVLLARRFPFDADA